MKRNNSEFNDYVLVVDRKGQPLMPCLSKRARILRKENRARIYCMNPFTIQIKDRLSENSELQDIEIKIDPGSKVSALVACVQGKKRGWFAIRAIHIEHRLHIRQSLLKRKAVRMDRRSRKNRYRPARFNNRIRKPRLNQGYANWLAPSIISKIENIVNIIEVWQKYLPINCIVGELNKFDTQKMINPEISGTQYQQGTLQEFEVREYLLCKFDHTCVYCKKSGIKNNTRLEVDHVIAKSKGGSDKINNLVISCHDCNQRKNNQPLEIFLSNKPILLKKIKKQISATMNLEYAGHMNTMRNELYKVLENRIKLKLKTFNASQTKFNRTTQKYRKNHWVDACCVGPSGQNIDITHICFYETWKAIGRGNRQMCKMDKNGFPRSGPKKIKRYFMNNGTSFQTGDIVQLKQPSGKHKGEYKGRVAIRADGRFDILLDGKNISSRAQYFKHIRKFNGYHISINKI